MSTKYKIMAVDLDGTLLDTEKNLSTKNKDAINKALKTGAHVVLATGRGLEEIGPLLYEFEGMDYAICVNGAFIKNLRTGKIVKQIALSKEQVKYIFDYIEGKDIKPLLHSKGKTYVQRDYYNSLEYYHMPEFKRHYEEDCIIIDDVVAFCKADDFYAEKICLYHSSSENRDVTREHMRANLPGVVAIDSECTSCEVSAEGADKGAGLRALADELGVPMEETIAVGDSGNDVPMLEAAGLTLVMENAEDKIKAYADEILPSNNDDGVAYAVEKYLL